MGLESVTNVTPSSLFQVYPSSPIFQSFHEVASKSPDKWITTENLHFLHRGIFKIIKRTSGINSHKK